MEDNRDVLRYLKLVLEMRGHRVRPASHLASAREELADRFDLLISDIELPDGSGLDLMRNSGAGWPGSRSAASAPPEDIQQSLEAGFALHLTKPIEIDGSIRRSGN